jgi:photosystem II stability/assembly factor-like uncharacterized protein
MWRRISVCLAVVCAGVLCGLPVLGQTWMPVGPSGGDVRALVADSHDPRAIYLGTVDGHIFGSRDGGEHWQLLGRVGDRLDSIVTAIVVDSRNSRRLYASTWTLGSNGGGAFESDDGGHTWRPSGLAGQSVRALAQAPSQPDILIAGTLAGVYRFRDSGKGWERISPANHDDLRNFDSVAIDPANPEVIYAGTYHLAWKTTDGGRHWSPIHAGMIDDSDVMSITLDDTNPQRVYASACSGIYRSENGGGVWTKFRGIPPTARRTHLIRQAPQNSQTIYSATTEGLWKTINSGATWNRITPSNWVITTFVNHPKTPDRLVLGVEGLGVYVSDDAGRNFRPANEGFFHRQVMDLAFDPGRPERMLLVLTNASEPVLATQDSGRTWVRLGPGLKTHLLRHVYAAPDGWWAALQGGGLMRYDHKANAWTSAGAAPAKERPAVKRGARLSAAKTASPLSPVVNDMAFARDLWLAATEEGLLASRDRGATWSPFPMGMQSNLPAHSVRVSADANRIWVLSPRGLNLSRDGGKTWSPQEFSFAARGRLRLYQAGEDTLVVASSSGLFVSSDAGKTWRPSLLPDPLIQDVAIAGNLWLVSTQKLGLYASSDRGKTWAHIQGILAEGYFPVLAARSTASTILAGSSTEGLFALEVSRGAEVLASDTRGTDHAASRTPQQ